MLALNIGRILAERIFIGFDAFGVFFHLIVRVAQVVVGRRFLLAGFGFFGCLGEMLHGFGPPFLLVHGIAQVEAAVKGALIGERFTVRRFRLGKIFLPVAFVSLAELPVGRLGERHQRE